MNRSPIEFGDIYVGEPPPRRERPWWCHPLGILAAVILIGTVGLVIGGIAAGIGL